MSKVEHGLSGKIAGRLPFLAERVGGLVEGWEKDRGGESGEIILYVADGGGGSRSKGVKVRRQDVDELSLGPGDGVEVRRLRLGDPHRPADYVKKREQAVRKGRLIGATTGI